MSGGWITLHRKLLDSPLAKNADAMLLWIHLLLKTNHKDGEYILGTQVINIPKGSLMTGRMSLSKTTGLHQSKVQRLLVLFQKMQFIEQQTFSKYRLISITNWSTYQDREQQVNNRRTTGEQQANTNNKVNNVNNVNKKEIIANTKRVNACPFTEIVKLYHEKLPGNPQVASLSTSRKAQIKARWNNGLPDLKSWDEFFSYVSESDFLMGRASASNGRKPFMANIDFLIKENNVLKIIEGNYHG